MSLQQMSKGVDANYFLCMLIGHILGRRHMWSLLHVLYTVYTNYDNLLTTYKILLSLTCTPVTVLAQLIIKLHIALQVNITMAIETSIVLTSFFALTSGSSEVHYCWRCPSLAVL